MGIRGASRSFLSPLFFPTNYFQCNLALTYRTLPYLAILEPYLALLLFIQRFPCLLYHSPLYLPYLVVAYPALPCLSFPLVAWRHSRNTPPQKRGDGLMVAVTPFHTRLKCEGALATGELQPFCHACDVTGHLACSGCVSL